MAKSFIILLVLTGIVACNNQSKETETKDPSAVTSGSGQQLTNENDPLMIATPAGYYEPQGLRKLNVMEMYKLGTSKEFKKGFPIKDKSGNSVDWTIMEDPAKPMFMQIYVDDKGIPTEGVVYELNDEIRSLIMKVRMTNNQ